MEAIEPRVQKLESSHALLQQELHQMNKTLSKIEVAIENQNAISTDIRLLRQEFKGHTELENDSVKRQNARIEALEATQSKLAWMIITAVVMALLSLIFIGGLHG